MEVCVVVLTISFDYEVFEQPRWDHAHITQYLKGGTFNRYDVHKGIEVWFCISETNSFYPTLKFPLSMYYKWHTNKFMLNNTVF